MMNKYEELVDEDDMVFLDKMSEKMISMYKIRMEGDDIVLTNLEGIEDRIPFDELPEIFTAYSMSLAYIIKNKLEENK